MFARLFRRRPSFPPVAPDGTVYAVGDIHGRADLLESLLERVRCEAAGMSEAPLLVFLGDYVDRGPASRKVVEAVRATADWAGLRAVYLRGNHEAMLLGFLKDPVQSGGWLRLGGAETLESYGVEVPEPEGDPNDLVAAAQALERAMGEHAGFLRDTRLSHRTGNLLCVHAAADPARAPEAQERRALLWGHPDFLKKPRTDGVWIVHGHTVVARPVAEAGRISIDTGAYATGCLTAARIADGEVAFLSTDAPV